MQDNILYTSGIDDNDIVAVRTTVARPTENKTEWLRNCPNCGAPISGGPCCEYCGTHYRQ